ncbi:hypothetical protein EV191_1011382 [Tamaricihabitans halophyticus]|uniref:Anti-sigma-M factor RsmA n=1 Tax=Tamaricihabitans halophyticus TaxID=1262583 RepID=A0A4R2R5X3_9PSEU|nr:hypothetical protein [Tamaricihabitans halophyticus]TCP57427.1 hypothetical protein EV191_1011382 [Tamaricihabitans halophyticus]
MTDTSWGHGGQLGPPWSVDVLADLQAGVLDPETEAQLWPQVNADPEARAILAALDETTADLNALGAAPAPPMPAEFAARLDAAIADEVQQREATGGQQSGGAQVVDIATARRRKQRKIAGWGTGILGAAAAAAAIVFATNPATTSTPGEGVAAPSADSDTAEGPMALTEDTLGSQYAGALGARDYGPLDDPDKLSQCLAANEVDPSIEPAGVKEITLDGQQGVLVILPTQEAAAQFQLLVVGSNCGPDNPDTLANTVVGG